VVIPKNFQPTSMRHFHGLTLTTRSGISWRWVGYAIAHVRGRDWRVEKWEAPCPRCGETVTVRAKLPSGLRSQFYLRRYNFPPSQIVEVRLALDNNTLLKALHIGECHEHTPASTLIQAQLEQAQRP
jgi:hypothetical protein